MVCQQKCRARLNLRIKLIKTWLYSRGWFVSGYAEPGCWTTVFANSVMDLAPTIRILSNSLAFFLSDSIINKSTNLPLQPRQKVVAVHWILENSSTPLANRSLQRFEQCISLSSPTLHVAYISLKYHFYKLIRDLRRPDPQSEISLVTESQTCWNNRKFLKWVFCVSRGISNMAAHSQGLSIVSDPYLAHTLMLRKQAFYDKCRNSRALVG